MPDVLGIVLLYALGAVLLISEIFVPAHGLLGAVGVVVLGFGVYQTFQMSENAGLVGLAVLAVVLPTGVIVSIKNWHRTPAGRRISPPNPKLGAEDRLPVEDLKPLIGRVGRTVTLLRPVGTCVFDGRRVECVAETSVIESGVEVEAVRLVDRTVAVRPVQVSSGDSTSV